MFSCQWMVLRAASILAPGLPHHAVGLTVCSGSINTFQLMGNSTSKGLLRLGIRKAARKPTTMRVPHACIYGPGTVTKCHTRLCCQN